MAEGAIERTANLRADAKRAGFGDIGNKDAFDLNTGRHADEIFAGAVNGNQPLHDFGSIERKGRVHLSAQRFGDICHLVK